MKQNTTLIKRLTCIILAVAFVLLDVTAVSAEEPYETYSYDFWSEDVKQPPSYLHKETYDFSKEDISLSYPEDMFIHEDYIYIADTNNSRIVILQQDGSFVRLIDSFQLNGIEDSFNKPQGIYVNKDGHLYVADSANSRIVELDENDKFVRTIERPVTDLISANQAFTPTKVVVDESGRIYTTCYGINMGLVEFNKAGEFQGFIGATEVSVSPLDYIWKNYFSTDEQKNRMETIIPTEYSNIYLDHEKFIYATISNLSESALSSGADAIRRLNPTGVDILRRLGNYPINGDLYRASQTSMFSKFTDVVATDYGCYFVLDSAGGKVFAYDYDGNNLFVFGGIGGREGNVQKPVSIGISEDNKRLYILDSLLSSVLVFEITEYGNQLLSALNKHSMGDNEGAYMAWNEVLRLNSNSEFAYTGLGKTFLKEGNYKEAMDYFKLGNNRKYYTKAFKFYRKELMQDYFGSAMAVVGVGVIAVVSISRVKKYKRWVGEIRATFK